VPGKKSNHLRHCPKHRKPLPCLHCALIAASAVVAEPEPVKRGRGAPKKYQTDAERKAAEAASKREKRAEAKANEIIAAHPDDLGSIGERSGGYNSEKIEQVVGAQQAAEALGLGTDRKRDEYGGFTDWSPPDRKRVAVPVIEKEDTDWEPEAAANAEQEDVFIEKAMRKNASGLRDWLNWHRLKKRECPFKDKHPEWARKHKDSPRKVYCARCKKLLVNPGKWVVGADGKRENFRTSRDFRYLL